VSGAPRRAVLLDRDGTLLETDDYLCDPAGVRLVEGAAAALGRLADAGWSCVVVTNQSGIARGLVTEADYARVEKAVDAAVRTGGGSLAGSYACFHLPEGTVRRWAKGCDCRKPKPGLLLRAARELGLDLARSICVGDAPRDLEAGRAAGVGACVLVRTGKGRASEAAVAAAGLADGVIDSLADLPAWAERRGAG
jgi:D-glycero-D-manno-heptose 1,7-bisphosphate phosphatase